VTVTVHTAAGPPAGNQADSTGPVSASRPDAAPAVADLPAEADRGFSVHLDNFDGPFDLLLGLIGKHELDICEIALSQVTDDFLTHLQAQGPDLEQTTEFLVVAATLLDLKTARLLPAAEVDDEDDLAVLEARDLLFARLLQYRAFKQVAGTFGARLAEQARRHPRAVGVDQQFAGLLPDVVFSLGAEQFAALAARALAPRPEPVLSLGHLHAPAVSVRDQAGTLVLRLRRLRTATFRTLVQDSPDTPTTVARFLALLELYREGTVAFEQMSPLGELYVRWTGDDDAEITVSEEFDGQPTDPPGDEGGP
jgi:segregation and condensation protein A